MSSAPGSDQVRILGRYALYGEIAKGGMASVHLGRLLGSVGFTRSVAIKRLHARYADNRDFVEMLIDEARLAARIRHPNVVPVLDVVTHGEEVFLVMEYIQGESLSRLLKASGGNAVPTRIAVSVVAGALYGLHAAHEAQTERGEPLNIVHRDVSPQNVLVGTDGLARVTDFGIAKAAKRLHETRSGEIKGKISYMSPEQIEGRPLDRRADVYSASVVLWESLTGRRLFAAHDTMEIVQRIMHGTVPPPRELEPSIPKDLEDVVMRGLSLDPTKRYATAREMAVAVERALPGAPAAEVAEWVEITAVESLARRAAALAAMERASATTTKLELSPFDDSHDDTQRYMPGLTETFAPFAAEPAPASAAPAPSSKTLTVPMSSSTLPDLPPQDAVARTVFDARISADHTPSVQVANAVAAQGGRNWLYLLVASILLVGLISAAVLVLTHRGASSSKQGFDAPVRSAPLGAPPASVELTPLVPAQESSTPAPATSATTDTSAAPRASAHPPKNAPHPPKASDDDFGTLLRK